MIFRSRFTLLCAAICLAFISLNPQQSIACQVNGFQLVEKSIPSVGLLKFGFQDDSKDDQESKPGAEQDGGSENKNPGENNGNSSTPAQATKTDSSSPPNSSTNTRSIDTDQALPWDPAHTVPTIIAAVAAVVLAVGGLLLIAKAN